MPSYCLTATCTAEQRAKHTAESQRSKQHLKTLQAAGLRLPSSSEAGQRARPAGRNRLASSSSAEHYRQLARECLQIAQTLPPGDGRDTVLDMARAWERLADQQEHATDLRPKE